MSKYIIYFDKEKKEIVDRGTLEFRSISYESKESWIRDLVRLFEEHQAFVSDSEFSEVYLLLIELQKSENRIMDTYYSELCSEPFNATRSEIFEMVSGILEYLEPGGLLQYYEFYEKLYDIIKTPLEFRIRSAYQAEKFRILAVLNDINIQDPVSGFQLPNCSMEFYGSLNWDTEPIKLECLTPGIQAHKIWISVWRPRIRRINRILWILMVIFSIIDIFIELRILESVAWIIGVFGVLVAIYSEFWIESGNLVFPISWNPKYRNVFYKDKNYWICFRKFGDRIQSHTHIYWYYPPEKQAGLRNLLKNLNAKSENRG